MPAAQSAPRQFTLKWFGGQSSLNSGVSVTTPSTPYPGRIGVRLPEYVTNTTTDPTNGTVYRSTNDALVQRGTMSIDATGAITLEGGVAFMQSSTTVVTGQQTLALMYYPILVRGGDGIEAGTVGTDWLVHRFTRPNGTSTPDRVVLVALVKASPANKGVWIRHGGNKAVTLTEHMTFQEFVNGSPIGGIQPVRVGCNATDGSAACVIGRVIESAVNDAKLIDMLPQGYVIPPPP